MGEGRGPHLRALPQPQAQHEITTRTLSPRFHAKTLHCHSSERVESLLCSRDALYSTHGQTTSAPRAQPYRPVAQQETLQPKLEVDLIKSSHLTPPPLGYHRPLL